MNIANETIMDGNYKIATIDFLDNGRQCERPFALYDEDIRIGDVCVVKAAHHGFTLGTVTSIAPKEVAEEEVICEVVCKVNFLAYDQRQISRQRRATILKEMQDRAMVLQEMSIYKTLALTDPTMAALLKEYIEIGGVVNG